MNTADLGDLDAAVERLRGERTVATPPDFDRGVEAGRRWALKFASLADFRRLERIRTAPSTLARLALELWPPESFTNDDRAERLADLGAGQCADERVYVEGLIAGAVETWASEIAPRLEAP